MYYGTSGYQDFERALQIFKLIEESTTDPELKGHALFRLGMMQQFGEGGVELDHDLANHYYEKALREKSSALAPIYIMSLYSRWQRLNLVETVFSFFKEMIEEPWSKGAFILLAQLLYCLFMFCTVRFLRKESHRDEL